MVTFHFVIFSYDFILLAYIPTVYIIIIYLIEHININKFMYLHKICTSLSKQISNICVVYVICVLFHTKASFNIFKKDFNCYVRP